MQPSAGLSCFSAVFYAFLNHSESEILLQSLKLKHSLRNKAVTTDEFFFPFQSQEAILRAFSFTLARYVDRKLETPVLFPCRRFVAGGVNQCITHFSVP